MASMDAREAASPIGGVGKVRVLVRPLGAGSLSPGRAERSSSHSRRWSFRTGHGRRRDRRTGPGLRRFLKSRGRTFMSIECLPSKTEMERRLHSSQPAISIAPRACARQLVSAASKRCEGHANRLDLPSASRHSESVLALSRQGTLYYAGTPRPALSASHHPCELSDYRLLRVCFRNRSCTHRLKTSG